MNVSGLFLHVLFVRFFKAALSAKCKKSIQLTQINFYLKNHVYDTRNVCIDVGECLMECINDGRCYSINFREETKTCELNDASKEPFPLDFIPKKGCFYGFNVYKQKSSCAYMKSVFPHTASGYHQILVHGKLRTVYCDMEKFGGGWTLVVSISGSSADHTIRQETNCFNSTLCVPNPQSTFAARKLSDADIHAIANVEGTFRIDVRSGPNSPFTVFYRIPSGADKFDASCRGETRNCPRIMISYSHPYDWESNECSNNLGYHISNGGHTMFDNHDDGECGEDWRSSKIDERRAMYGLYPYNGLATNLNGLVFVK